MYKKISVFLILCLSLFTIGCGSKDSDINLYGEGNISALLSKRYSSYR